MKDSTGPDHQEWSIDDNHGFELQSAREFSILTAGRLARFVCEFDEEPPPMAWQFLHSMRILWPNLANELDAEEAEEKAAKAAKSAKDKPHGP